MGKVKKKNVSLQYYFEEIEIIELNLSFECVFYVSRWKIITI